MIIMVILASFVFLSSDSKVTDEQFRTLTIKSIINSQSSCHVHFVNKKNIRIDGEIKPPITIDTESVKSISLPLTRVKPLTCVVILISKFIGRDIGNSETINFSQKLFKKPFLRDVRSRINIYRFSVFIFAVNIPTNRLLQIINNHKKHVLLFRFVGIVYFVPSTKKEKPHTKTYIVCRYVGERGSPLLSVEFH